MLGARLDGLGGSVATLLRRPVPAEVRQSFRASFIGWEHTSLYLQVSGCPGPECWGDRVQRIFFKIEEAGGIEQVHHVPASARFKGQSLAPHAR